MGGVREGGRRKKCRLFGSEEPSPRNQKSPFFVAVLFVAPVEEAALCTFCCRESSDSVFKAHPNSWFLDPQQLALPLSLCVRGG